MKITAIPQVYRNANRWGEIVTILSKYGLAGWISRFDVRDDALRLAILPPELLAQVAMVRDDQRQEQEDEQQLLALDREARLGVARTGDLGDPLVGEIGARQAKRSDNDSATISSSFMMCAGLKK